MRPSFRLSLRFVLGAVAYAGLVLSMEAYRERLLGRAAFHAWRAAGTVVRLGPGQSPPVGAPVFSDPRTGASVLYFVTPVVARERSLAIRYEWAAWLVGALIGVVLILTAVVAGVAVLARLTVREGPVS